MGDCHGNEEHKEVVKSKLTYFNNFLEKNKFIGGEKLSYADFILAECSYSINSLLEHIFKEYPTLKSHFEAISELPSIKKYTETRMLPFNNKFSKMGAEVPEKK